LHNSIDHPKASDAEKSWQIPDTLIIIFIVGVLATILTYLIPAGSFTQHAVSFIADGVEKTRTVIDPASFKYALDANGEKIYNTVGFFSAGGGIGLMNFMFEGLVSGDKWGSAVGVIMFMLVIGGAFGVVMRTGAIDAGILALIHKTKGNDFLFIPALFVLFSLGGAVFGMGEEAIAFAIIIAPLMLRLGYDGITTVMVTYVATQVGFASSWMNPFSVAIAQGIAASQFFTMGFIAGIIGIIFKLNNMKLNDIATSFKEGAAVMLAPALLVGCAKGVLIILGDGSANEPSVLNSILNSAGGAISGIPDVAAVWIMYLFQSVFNFFVTSGSGQAALTMPLLAPLGDIAGVSRQVTVLAFQLGDGFTNIVVPTSASLMGTLGVCRIDWGDWIRFSWRFMLLLFVTSSVTVVCAHLAGFN
jgi:uncharacterized ion transporter superfamily protein YfcC